MLCKTLPLWLGLLLSAVVLSQAQSRLYPVQIEGRWGMIDTTGRVVVKAVYDQVGRYVKNDYAYVQQGTKLGAINRAGQEVLPCRYDQLEYLGGDFFAATTSKGRFLISSRGEVLVDSLDGVLTPMRLGFFKYETAQGVGAIFEQTGLVALPIYESVQVLVAGAENYMVATDKAGQQQLFTIDGQAVLPTTVTDITYDGRLLWAKVRGHWGAYGTGGQLSIEHRWASYRHINAGIYELADEAPLAAFYSLTADSLIGLRGENAAAFEQSDVLFVDEQNNRCVINREGQLLISIANCEAIQSLGQLGLYQYKRNGLFGVYQTGVGEQTKAVYEHISAFDTEVALVRRNERWGVINRAGQEVVSPQYKEPLTLSFNQVRYRAADRSMQLFNFDEEGQLLARQKYNNMRSLRISGTRREFTAASSTGSASNRNNPYQINDTLCWVYHQRADSWGLMNIKTNQYKYPPKWASVTVLPDQGLSIVQTKSSTIRHRVRLEKTDVFWTNHFGLFNNEHGLPISLMEFVDIRVADFRKGLPVARCVFTDGKHGIIGSNGRVLARGYTYIGEFSSGLAPATKKGRLVADLEGRTDIPTIIKASTYFRMMMSRFKEDPDAHIKYYQQLLNTGVLYTKEAKWGYLDTFAQVAIGFQYDHAEPHRYDYARVFQDGKWGMIDTEGMTSLDISNDTLEFLPNTDERLYLVKRYRPLYGMLDSSGQISVPMIYQRLNQYQGDRLVVQDTLGGWGILDREGRVIVPCQHRKIRDYQDGRAAYRQNYRWGYYDEAGQAVTEPIYWRCGDFSEGKAWVRLNGNKSGYIDRQGQLLIEGRYSVLTDFHEGRAAVKVNGKGWGIIDETGAFILKPNKRYKKILPYSEDGVTFVLVGKKYRLINRAGEWQGKRRYGTVRPHAEGIAAVRYQRLQGFHIGKRNLNWALIDTAGEAITKTQFRHVHPYQEGRARFKSEKGRFGYLDRQGNIAVPPIYLKASDFKDNRAVVFEAYNRSGVIDTTGKVVIDLAYNRIEDHQHGRTVVRLMGKGYHYLNEAGQRPSTALYSRAKPYYHQVALIQVGRYWGLINQQGILVRLPQFDHVGDFQAGRAPIAVVHQYGVTDRSGKVLLEPIYDYITYMGGGLFRVEKSGKVGYINREGTWVWALQ